MDCDFNSTLKPQIPQLPTPMPLNTITSYFSSGHGLAANQNDLALLKLRYKLTFTEDVNAVCLPDTIFSPRTVCIAAGWGLDESGGNDFLLIL